MIAQMKVQIFLALQYLYINALIKYCKGYTIMIVQSIPLFTLFMFYNNPSAGIGRQGKFKLC